jgi:hypothetical protein
MNEQEDPRRSEETQEGNRTGKGETSHTTCSEKAFRVKS